MLIKYVNVNDMYTKYDRIKIQILTTLRNHGFKLSDDGDVDVFTIDIPKTKLENRYPICGFQIINNTFEMGNIIIYPFNEVNEKLIIDTIIPKFDDIEDLIITINRELLKEYYYGEEE